MTGLKTQEEFSDLSDKPSLQFKRINNLEVPDANKPQQRDKNDSVNAKKGMVHSTFKVFDMRYAFARKATKLLGIKPDLNLSEYSPGEDEITKIRSCDLRYPRERKLAADSPNRRDCCRCANVAVTGPALDVAGRSLSLSWAVSR